MNKKNRKIITVVLAAAMTLSAAGAASAATTEAQTGAVKVAATTGAAKTAETLGANVVKLNNGYAIPSGSNLGRYTTIKSNTAYTYNTGSYSSDYYVLVPIRPTHTGELRVSSYGYGQLLNSSGRVLSDKIYVSPDSTYNKSISFGVKSGRTYYYKAYGNGNYQNGVYANGVAYRNLSYSNTRFGTSRSGERKLRTGSSHRYKGTIVSGGSSKYFRYTKRGKTTYVYVTVKTDERTRVTFSYRFRGKTYTRSRIVYRGNQKVYLRTNVIGANAATVTYHVKVNPIGNSSCVFSTYCK